LGDSRRVQVLLRRDVDPSLERLQAQLWCGISSDGYAVGVEHVDAAGLGLSGSYRCIARAVGGMVAARV